MASDLQQQVDELLVDLAAVFGEESADDGQPDPEALDELTDRAAELVSSTDLSELLGASGIGDEDDPPASLPAAVASGEPQNVARLRSLLTASKLSTDDDDGREDRVDELQSLVETVQGESAAADSTSEATGDDTEGSTDGSDEETESTETEAEDDEESASPIRDLLKSQLEETHGIFDAIPDIETLTGGLGGDGNEDDEDTETVDEDTETADEDESHEDQSTRQSDGTRWRPGGGQQATHSTVPGAGRRDIGRRAGRFSSARGSTVSKR